ncbi:MAG: outer membrane lipoprotein-sorting protein [Acidobacteriota bacterium]|nr:outer membrane lipoprotein-sorting protein [Acidobacteriota bacterium]MDH3786851.1 outer membrane lipoprotein-sorting protein [Acidobacteriota bacterium]
MMRTPYNLTSSVLFRASRGLVLGAAFIALAIGPAFADTLDVDTIVARANAAAYYAGDDGRAEVRLTIVDAQGREQRRQFTILRRDVEQSGDQQFLVVFSQPSDLRNTVFLVTKHAGADDDRWLYLPGLDLVKRISAGDKRTSFVGSHVLYEDVSGRGVDEDRHELVETTADAYVLRHTPTNPSAVEFATYTTWIDRSSFLPTKIEYTDRKGEVYRRISSQEVREIQGHPTVVKSLVEDLAGGGSTRMEFRYITYDTGVPENIFGERSLRQPPARWMKRPTNGR